MSTDKHVYCRLRTPSKHNILINNIYWFISVVRIYPHPFRHLGQKNNKSNMNPFEICMNMVCINISLNKKIVSITIICVTTQTIQTNNRHVLELLDQRVIFLGVNIKLLEKRLTKKKIKRKKVTRRTSISFIIISFVLSTTKVVSTYGQPSKHSN